MITETNNQNINENITNKNTADENVGNEKMDEMVKEGIISPKKIKINVTEEIKQINQNLKKICDGIKCETSYRPFTPTPVLDLFEVGLLQELDENKLTVSYLEKFKSDISRVGSMITTNKPLVQAYKQEFKDINYKLVEIIEYIRNYPVNVISKITTDNETRISDNEKRISYIESWINAYDEKRAARKRAKKDKKISEKIILGILIATSVITTTLSIKSCINDAKQTKEIDDMKTKNDWIKTIGDNKQNTNTLIIKMSKQKTK